MATSSDRVYAAGVIGLGVMGAIADGEGGRHPSWYPPCCHADAYAFHGRTELTAGCTRDPGRQERFRKKHPDAKVYADYREMLEKEELDFVSIATPATCHAEMVIAAAEAGVKAIYCEKAMATSLAECDAMMAACEKSSTVLAINHQRRWEGPYQSLRRLVRNGIIGPLQSILVHFGGGRLCRGGSHSFDLALYFADDPVRTGSGWLSNPDDFDPGGVGLFETAGGIRIIIDGCTGMNHQLAGELVGERGILKIIDGGFEFELWTPDETNQYGQLARRHLPMNFPVQPPMLTAIDDMIGCIERGGQPISSGKDGRAAFEMITAIHLSHRAGRQPIAFPLSQRDYRIESN